MSSEPFIGEIMLFGGNFAPRGWAFCDGRLIAISQNTALFALLGTTYGGDGKSTFALPDLRARGPRHPSEFNPLGAIGGNQTVTLLPSELPAHTHSMRVSDAGGNTDNPANAVLARDSTGLIAPFATAGETAIAPGGVSPTGGGLPHNNMPPYLSMNFIIALQGIFPPRP